MKVWQIDRLWTREVLIEFLKVRVRASDNMPWQLYASSECFLVEIGVVGWAAISAFTLLYWHQERHQFVKRHFNNIQSIYYAFTTWHCRRRHYVSRPFVHYVHPFIYSFRHILLTTISYEWLEQFRWNLQGTFTSPLLMTWLDSGGQRSGHSRSSLLRRHLRRCWALKSVFSWLLK